MPELPEVETTLSGIQPHIENERIIKVIIRHSQLRWPIPTNISQDLLNEKVIKIYRRAKYLLLTTSKGTLILHLGMSGSLRILTAPCAAKKHDHVDIEFANKKILRFTDPRRFGAILWTEKDPLQHALLKNLGPEPFDKEFSKNYLLQQAKTRSVPIKSFIMDNKIVVGAGNIYATEALFLSKIHPLMPAKEISAEQAGQLVKAIKLILKKAIKQGGTTLKDFVNSNGKPGYFSQYLNVYGKAGLPCPSCHTELQLVRINQRSTVFCEVCQKK